MKRIKRLVITFIIIAIVLSICVYIDNFTFKLTEYSVSTSIPESFKGTKIVQISDLHNEIFGNNNSTLTDVIDKITPDYIFLTGDLVNAEDIKFDGIYTLAREIGEKYKCYFIVGNHELGLSKSDLNHLISKLEEYGIKYLDNEFLDLNSDVRLYGLNYKEKYYLNKYKYTVDDMNKDLGKSDKSKYNILLAHNPFDFDTYSEWGADLVFSGHTHGGMVKIFGNGIISTDRTIFPEYDGGVYESGDSIMINSAGLSRGHIGIRLFNQPELIVVEL